MTINELEQGLRNLIATQPMVTAGANGEVVAGINAIIDAFRNFSFRVQTYPCQDIMKFGLSNEAAKLENTLSNLVLQVMQERGFNLLLYIPRSAPGAYGPTVNQYGMVTPNIDPNMMMGQMMYHSNSMPNGNAFNNINRTMNSPVYNPLQPQMVGLAAGYPKPQRGPAQTFPGYQQESKPVQVVPNTQTENSVKPMASAQTKIKPAPKVTITKTVETTKEPEKTEATSEQPHTPSPAEILIAGATGGAGVAEPSGKAKGRDYLVELLKK